MGGVVVQNIDRVDLAIVDNEMLSLILRAVDFGLTGYESTETLEANDALKSRLEAIRLKAGVLMGLGDVADKIISKMCLISRPHNGGFINTRTFIPHRVHKAVGVLGAACAAAACMIPNGLGKGIADFKYANPYRADVEHPSGALTVEIEWDGPNITRTALLRTARKIMDGIAFP